MKFITLLCFLFITTISHCHDLETDALMADEYDVFNGFGFAPDEYGYSTFFLDKHEIKFEYYQVHGVEAMRQFVAQSSIAKSTPNDNQQIPQNRTTTKVPDCQDGDLNEEGWGICGGGDLGHIEFNIRMARVAAIEFCNQLPMAMTHTLVPYYVGPDSFALINDSGYPEMVEYHHDEDVDFVDIESLYSIEDGIEFKCAFNVDIGTTY